MKGILSIQGSDDRFVFQGVHMMLDMTTSADSSIKPWGPDEKRVCKIVFIGKHLDKEAIRKGFHECLQPPKPNRLASWNVL